MFGPPGSFISRNWPLVLKGWGPLIFVVLDNLYSIIIRECFTSLPRTIMPWVWVNWKSAPGVPWLSLKSGYATVTGLIGLLFKRTAVYSFKW